MIFILSRAGVERLLALTRYLTPQRWILLFCVGLFFTALTAHRTLKSLKKQVYPNAAKENDLPRYTDEEVTA